MDWNINQYRVLGGLFLDHLIPYLIIIINSIIASLTRSFIGKLLNYNLPFTATKDSKPKKSGPLIHGTYAQFIRVILNELISTVELCAACAELNVIYEKHGASIYGLVLLILTFRWTSSFEDALTSPGYMVEELLQTSNKSVLFGGVENYARFAAQLLAASLAWRFASFYWSFNFIKEHQDLLDVGQCKSSLTTGTLVGLGIELVCSMVCRLAELMGHRLHQRRRLSLSTLNWSLSLISTGLVLIALEKSGGYFNPILASSLEFGCKGTSFAQHAIVFWLGPLLGHLLARFLFRELLDTAQVVVVDKNQNKTTGSGGASRRLTRSTSQQKKLHTN